jgi:predicted  nucleic acid-binding Zn-ribbon protein
VRFLKRLEEDLRVLKNSWMNKNLHPKRVVRHFVEIVDSISEIAQAESLEPAEIICADLKDYLASVAGGRASLGERSWVTALELVELVSNSLNNGSGAAGSLEELHARWVEGAASSETATNENPDSPGCETHPSWETFDEPQTYNLEENKMVDPSKMDPQELLQEAQNALLSGDGGGAKEMALKAAEMIVKIEAEERKKRESALRDILGAVLVEESELENSISQAEEAIGGREEELNELTERLSEAQSAFDERETECKEIRGEIDNAETEIASIKEKHLKLLDRLQEMLPARDAAERQCAKIKGEYGELPTEIESLRDNLHELELRMEPIRQRKTDAEAELAEISQEITI